MKKIPLTFCFRWHIISVGSFEPCALRCAL
uniref:Uncharacterized protein n=2 Tax=unclassified Caudoviricetes TaxID=2788787 RepID=A0A8S5Q748_9CAUD|nr:MAG TPA: hypothetical protein [Siphoviridae sp. ctAvK3]DAE15190.1 MAG TPA: hypothetical protein [Siphoviridae sp. ctdVv30]